MKTKVNIGIFLSSLMIYLAFPHIPPAPQIELVDEPAEFVAPLLEAYRDALLGARPPSELWSWLGTLPDANGRIGGVGAGSLAVRPSRANGGSHLKQTAAALKQQLRNM